MSTVRILGIGSPSGDDQAGWLVVDALANRLPAHVKTARLDRPGTALIPQLETANRIILVDAIQGGGEPGEVHHFADGEWSEYRSGLSSHGLGVFGALMLARELGCLPAQLEIYGIEIASALPGSKPSATIVAAARRLADQIADLWHQAG